jgi:Carboxypeptidase regulatory-like domain
MIRRVLGATLLAGLAIPQSATLPAVGCRDTHEWVEVEDLVATTVVGRVEVRYPGGDSARLPEATVIVARVQPFIQAYVTQTDSRGEFTMPQVPEGRWRVNVCKAGFKTLEASLAIGGNTGHPPLRLTTELDW